MQVAATFANRALERESWARARLAAHAGRTVRIAVGPATVALTVAASGLLEAAQAAPDLTLTISPLRLPTLLAQPERWSELVTADGDAVLAATLAELAQTLPWFVEREFARFLGPIVGTRVADTGHHLLALPDYAAQRLSESIASYVRDEADLAVRGSEVRAFAAEIEALATRVDALAARIDALAEPTERR